MCTGIRIVRAWSAIARVIACRVRRKLISAAPFELVHGLHQPDVAFLNQVEELQSAVRIFFRNGNNQAQVRFDQFLLRLFGFRFAAMDKSQRALQLGESDLACLFNIFQFRPPRPQFFARFRGHVAFRGVHAPFEPSRFAFQ
jgi:hypothetical protein